MSVYFFIIGSFYENKNFPFAILMVSHLYYLHFFVL